MNEYNSRDIFTNIKLWLIKKERGLFSFYVIMIICLLYNTGIVGDDFIFTGTMNLTHYGITVKDESLSFSTETEQVEEWKISLEDTWNEKLK